jgi:hypothetical protein
MNFAEILEYVNTMKTLWARNHYSLSSHNCRDFVRALGNKLHSIYNPPHYLVNLVVNNLPAIFGHDIDITFPQNRQVN